MNDYESVLNLSKLLILDFSMNPLSLAMFYRLKMIYNVPKLKVLDSVTISQDERKMSNDKFLGRMTLETLLHGRHAESLTEIDLSNQKIR